MRAKRILPATAAVAGALVLAAFAALSPAVQTRAARRMAPLLKRPGTSIGRLAVRPGRASVEGLHAEIEGAVIDLPSAQAELDVLPALLGRGYHLRSLVARGWTIDLTRPGAPPVDSSGSGYPWIARALGGILAAFNVKADLSLDGVQLEGDVLFPGEDGRPAARAHLVVTGGGLGEGRDGRFICAGMAVADDPATPVSSVSVTAVLTAVMDASGTFTRADIKADATALGAGFPSGISLSFVAKAARMAGKESYSVTLVRGAERVAEFNAEGPGGALRMAGSWRLDLRDTDLAPFALGRSLPAFHVVGDGTYEADPSTGDAEAAGKLRASANRLGVLAGELGALGPVGLVADFDVARVGPTLRVARLDTNVSGAGPVLAVRALQSFEFNPSSGELKVAAPSDDLVGISVKGIPLRWLRGVLPKLDLAGSDLLGEFVMRAEDGRLVLRTRAPLVSTGVSLSHSGKVIAAGLEVSAFILADYAPQGWQFQLAPLAIRSDGLKMLSLEARFGRLAGSGREVKAAGSWSASLPLLLSVPAAARLPRLGTGDASGSVEASLGSRREVSVKLALANLTTASGAVLPSVTSEVRADFDPAGAATFSIPVHLDYGTRAADVAFSGALSTDKGGTLVDGTLSGSALTMDDVAAVAFLSGGRGAGADAPAASGPPATPRTTALFWPGYRARVELKVAELSVPHADLREVRGTLVIEHGSIALSGGTANVADGSPARVDGQVAFNPAADNPYSFRAAVSVDNVDSAPIFTAFDPDKAPVVEGSFDVEANLSGTGQSPGDLLEASQGDLRLSSKGGQFRALRTDIVDSIKQANSKLVDALDTVTALFGKKSENLGTALVESARELSDIHYDQMSISVERGADLDLRVTEITLIAPDERLTGKGTITHQDGVPIRDQPLSIDLDMGVQGRLGKFLDDVGMLKEGQDEFGYTQLYQPIHLGGTLRSVDQSQWREMLVQAPLRKGGGLFDKLLGK